MKKEIITLGNFEFEYYPCPGGSDRTMITILASSTDTSFLIKPAAKYFLKQGVNVVSFMPVLKGESYSGWKDFPLDKVEETVHWCLDHGSKKVGVAGASATSITSLTCASLIPEISLVMVMAVMDYVMQASNTIKENGKIKEWPEPNTSMFTWRGEQVPYSPYNLTKEEFEALAWDSYKRGDMNLLPLMDHIEKQPEFSRGFIPAENAHARIILIGADNDTGCFAGRNVRRLEKRLKDASYAYGVEAYTFPCCSHYIFPQSLVTNLLPIGSSLVLGLMFRSEKEHPKECAATRKEVDRICRRVISEW